MANEASHLLTRSVLESLGFRRNETSTYLEALYIGEATVSDLVARVKLPRSSVQEAVKGLQRKGLMQCYLKRHRKVWLAQDPQVLITKIREQEELLRKVLPQMVPGKRHGHAQPKIRMFTGEDELKSISSDVLNTRQHIYGIISWDVMLQIFGLETMDALRQGFHKNFLKMHLLVEQSEQALKMKNRVASEFLKIKFLSPDFHSHNSYYGYGNKVLIMLLSGSVPVGVVIEDENLANSFRYIFDNLWDRIP